MVSSFLHETLRALFRAEEDALLEAGRKEGAYQEEEKKVASFVLGRDAKTSVSDFIRSRRQGCQEEGLVEAAKKEAPSRWRRRRRRLRVTVSWG
tara:strand:- start:105 stop:386 length:282 start_codon:yes stop_codon:yes gene_type:complete